MRPLQLFAVVLLFLVVTVAGAGYWLTATFEPAPVNPAWALPGDKGAPPGAVTVRFTGTSTLLSKSRLRGRVESHADGIVVGIGSWFLSDSFNSCRRSQHWLNG